MLVICKTPIHKLLGILNALTRGEVTIIHLTNWICGYS